MELGPLAHQSTLHETRAPQSEHFHTDDGDAPAALGRILLDMPWVSYCGPGPGRVRVRDGVSRPALPERLDWSSGYAASDRGRSTCVALLPSVPHRCARPRTCPMDPKEHVNDFTPALQGG